MSAHSKLWTIAWVAFLALALSCAGPTKDVGPGGTEKGTSLGGADGEGAADGTFQVSGRKIYEGIQFPDLNEVKLPEINRDVLSNGTILFTLEDHELPLVRARAVIRTGSVYEPSEKVGLASLTGTVMRSGGTSTRAGDDLDETLEAIAASVETGIGTASGTASFSCLKEHFDQVLEVFADVLINPAFPEDKINLAKIQARTGISRRNDSPGGIVGREFSKLVYGAESPYARTTEYATIAAIERDDLVAFHKEYFHPDRMLLAIWGDIDPAAVKAQVEKAFAGWSKSIGDPPPPPPQLVPTSPPGVNYIRKGDINQTNIRIGHQGLRRDNPDFYGVTVLTRILGSGFSSRLFNAVRTKMGLAYSVGSFFRSPFYREGVFALYCQTKSETTHAAITAILDETNKIRTEEVTDDEIHRAKESIDSSFVFNFDSPGEIIGRRMDYEYYGYPADLLEQYRAGIAAVTKADVLRVANKYIQPEKFTILAVGKGEDFDLPLDSFGQVNPIDITIPAPPQEELPDATAEAEGRGIALLAEAAAAHGGEEGFAGITSYRASVNLKQQAGPGGPMMEYQAKQALRLPWSYRLDISTPMGDMTRAYDGEAGWLKMGERMMPLRDEQVKELKESFFRDPILLLGGFRKAGVQVQLLEGAEGDTSQMVLLRHESGTSVKAKIDNESKHLVGLAYSTVSPMGPVTVEETLSDFREVSGLLLAFSQSTKDVETGNLLQEVSVSEIEINPELSDDLFRKPENGSGEAIPPEEQPPSEEEDE